MTVSPFTQSSQNTTASLTSCQWNKMIPLSLRDICFADTIMFC